MKYKSFQRTALNLQVREERKRKRQRERERGKKGELPSKPRQSSHPSHVSAHTDNVKQGCSGNETG